MWVRLTWLMSCCHGNNTLLVGQRLPEVMCMITTGLSISGIVSTGNLIGFNTHGR